MSPLLLHAYVQMIPRIEAQESLHELHLGTLNSPYCESGYRSGVMSRWNALAFGRDPDRDAQGRALITSAADLRRWFKLEGGYTTEIQA